MRLLRWLLVTVVSAVPAGVAFAAGPQDPGTSFALNLTATTTIIIIAILFFVLVLPEADRKRMGSTFSSLRRYAIAGRSVDAEIPEHVYDGIRELDNRIPPWFTTLFFGTIVFAAVYMASYHVLGSQPLMIEEYRDEVSAADLQRRMMIAREGAIDENTLTALVDPAALGRGQDAFGKYCVSCHGPQGQGVVGPNLTDEFWIHGGGVKNVYAVIKNGVAAKGMISWALVFTPRQIQEIASYVLSLQGTNPPNAKKGEGEAYVEPAAGAAPADSAQAAG
ncbi:MAG: cbb3-type cytochrome c oxidase subunit [Bacteroidetes bacterium]|nr:cbb3-type cytochrome c oxidase subunit [Bacteroidota bacterium]